MFSKEHEQVKQRREVNCLHCHIINTVSGKNKSSICVVAHRIISTQQRLSGQHSTCDLETDAVCPGRGKLDPRKSLQLNTVVMFQRNDLFSHLECLCNPVSQGYLVNSVRSQWSSGSLLEPCAAGSIAIVFAGISTVFWWRLEVTVWPEMMRSRIIEDYTLNHTIV